MRGMALSRDAGESPRLPSASRHRAERSELFSLGARRTPSGKLILCRPASVLALSSASTIWTESARVEASSVALAGTRARKDHGAQANSPHRLAAGAHPGPEQPPIDRMMGGFEGGARARGASQARSRARSVVAQDRRPQARARLASRGAPVDACPAVTQAQQERTAVKSSARRGLRRFLASQLADTSASPVLVRTTCRASQGIRRRSNSHFA